MKKRCPKCKEEKHLSEFYKDNRRLDGLTCYCKICCNNNTRKYYNPEKARNYNNSEKGKKRTKKYIKSRGLFISRSGEKFILFYNEKILGVYHTSIEAEAVKSKFIARQARRKLEKEREKYDDYWDTL